MGSDFFVYLENRAKQKVFLQLFHAIRTLDMVEVAGLEPTASASRTQRSTKLSHTSMDVFLYATVFIISDVFLYVNIFSYFFKNFHKI